MKNPVEQGPPTATGIRGMWRQARVPTIVIGGGVAFWAGRYLVRGGAPSLEVFGREADRALFLWGARVAIVIWSILLAWWATGRWRRLRSSTGFGAGDSIAPPRVYLEAMAIFVVVVLVERWISRWIDHRAIRLVLEGYVGPTLIALLWATCRARGFRIARRDLGLRAGLGLRTEMGVGVLAALAMSSLALSVTWLLGVAARKWIGDSPDGLTGAGSDGSDLPWFLLLGNLLKMTVLVPLTEELAFRGMLYRGVRGFLGWRRAAWVTAGTFAVIHFPWQFWPAHLVTGLGYAYLREWRGSLVAPMTAHAAHNAVATLWLYSHVF